MSRQFIFQQLNLLLIFCSLPDCVNGLTLLMMKDLTADNQPYVHENLTTFVNSRVDCTRKCGVKNGRTTNFGRYDFDSGKCECFHFSKEFSDSRDIAPETKDSIFFISG